jgi:enamidase
MATTATVQLSGKVVIRNIGLMLSGDIENPILSANTIVVQNGVITAIGLEKDCDLANANQVIDTQQCAIAPGLIDSHTHPVFGDWTPRQSQLGWIESSMHGGVTSMISAGEVHLPGRPKDIVGVKALAITAQRAFEGMRAAGVGGGVKVLAGAPIIEQGMEEADFAELAAAGVTLLGEVGLGSVKAGDEAKKMVAWARKYGIQSTIHTGGPSVPGSGLMDKDVVLEADADVIGHINGGHTSLPYKHVCELCERSTRAIEIVHNGNERIGILTARHAMADIPAEIVIGFATGNISRQRKLAQGLIEVGRPADFVFMDKAQHSAGRDLLDSIQLGDIPGVGMVMIDGIVRCHRSRNTPPADRAPVIMPLQ